jgi:hypothetical protein
MCISHISQWTCSGCDHLVLCVFFFATRLALFWTLLVVVQSFMKDHAILDVCFSWPIRTTLKWNTILWTAHYGFLNDICRQDKSPFQTGSHVPTNTMDRTDYITDDCTFYHSSTTIEDALAQPLQLIVDQPRPLDQQPVEWTLRIFEDNLTDNSSCSLRLVCTL